MDVASPDHGKPPPTARAAASLTVCILSVLSGLGGVLSLRYVQFNVVNYKVDRAAAAGYLPPTVFASVVLAGIIALGLVAVRRAAAGRRATELASVLAPLLLCAAPAVWIASGSAPPMAIMYLFILGPAWAALRAGSRLSAAQHEPLGQSAIRNPQSAVRRLGGSLALPRFALPSLLLLIVALVVVHTRLQINFYEHLMFGHADIGHFAHEMKNFTLGRGLVAESTENPRMGWHFNPLLYLFAPGYYLWPTPKYLMVLAALFVHAAAVPGYLIARRLSGSAAVGWMCGVAWLMLPSTSRMPYAGTYGFQFSYAAIPLLAGMIAAGLTGRWKTSLVMAALLLSVKETAAAAVLGWGLFVMFGARRRALGAAISTVAVAYALLCVLVIIPHFATSGRYDRISMFAGLGETPLDIVLSPVLRPGEFFARLARPAVLHFLLMSIVPLALLPLAGWRLALASLPTLVPVLLISNADFLSIKFWNQATILPVLYMAAIAVVAPGATSAVRGGGRLLEWLSVRSASPAALARGAALALLTAACMAHYLFGFSPIAKGYEAYAGEPAIHAPDPKYAFVRHLQQTIPRSHSILATERLAIHFIDYDRLYTGNRPQAADYVIIDTADPWDGSGLPGRAEQFAADPAYRAVERFGTIVVFERDKK